MGSNLFIGASGAVSRLRQLEVVANNLANVNSTAFKADRAIFHAALEAAVGSGDKGPPAGAPGGVYVGTGEVRSDYTPGAVKPTGAPLDVAIEGPGFFVVETPEGERFTRGGSFVIGADGDLRTREGQRVLGTKGPIHIKNPETSIQANGDLVHLVKAKARVSGTLRVVEFEEPGLLSKQGSGLFRAPEGVQPAKVDSPALLVGSLEGSNVKPAAELAALMMLQRAFEASMHAMQADDDATERLIREISR